MGRVPSVVPLLFAFLLLPPPFCCDIPLGGPDPEVDEYIRQQFQDHADAFAAGIKDGWAEGLKKDAAEGGDLAELIKPENVAQLIANWVPERLRALLPKEWLLKLIKALTTEGTAVAQFYAGAERISSGDEFWRELRKKAPTTAELLEDTWAEMKKRWQKFNEMLNDESKQYVEKVKISGWEWFIRQVAGPFLRLSNDAKTNLTLSLFDAYPVMNMVMSKVMANRTLLEWAGEWYKKAEEQLQTMEREGNGTNEELNEGGIMAQMKEMFKRMNLGDLDDLMGGMNDEEEYEDEKEQMMDEESKREDGEEKEEQEETGKEKEDGTDWGEEGEGKEEEEEQREQGQCSANNEEGQCKTTENEEKAEKTEQKTQEEGRDEL